MAMSLTMALLALGPKEPEDAAVDLRTSVAFQNWLHIHGLGL